MVYPPNKRIGPFGKQQTFIIALDNGGRGEIAFLCSISMEEEADVMANARKGENKGLSLRFRAIA